MVRGRGRTQLTFEDIVQMVGSSGKRRKATPEVICEEEDNSGRGKRGTKRRVSFIPCEVLVIKRRDEAIVSSYPQQSANDLVKL